MSYDQKAFAVLMLQTCFPGSPLNFRFINFSNPSHGEGMPEKGTGHRGELETKWPRPGKPPRPGKDHSEAEWSTGSSGAWTGVLPVWFRMRRCFEDTWPEGAEMLDLLGSQPLFAQRGRGSSAVKLRQQPWEEKAVVTSGQGSQRLCAGPFTKRP